jgi:hypothetical protein
MNIPSSIRQAKAAAFVGDTRTALLILRQVITQDPGNVDAWLALADIVEKPEQARECLERVLQIDPNNQIARQRLLGKQPPDFDSGMGMQATREPEYRSRAGQASDSSGLVFQGPLVADPPAPAGAEQVQPRGTGRPQMESPATHLDGTRQKALPEQRPVSKKPAQKEKKGFSGLEIAVGSVIGFLVLCVCLLGLASLGNSGVLEPEPTALPEEITVVIYENIRASNAKDYDGYMATIHSKSPNYNATKEGIKTAFSDEYTLSYRLSDVYVIEQQRSRAVVHFVLTTRLIRGPSGFRDNRVTGEMKLRTEDGAWKIYDQEVIEIEYLD